MRFYYKETYNTKVQAFMTIICNTYVYLFFNYAFDMKDDVEITYSPCNCIYSICLHTCAWFQNVFSSMLLSLPDPAGVICQPRLNLVMTLEVSL